MMDPIWSVVKPLADADEPVRKLDAEGLYLRVGVFKIQMWNASKEKEQDFATHGLLRAVVSGA